MKVKELVGKGYLPHEELPPAFNTEKLGSEALSIDNSFFSFKKKMSKKKRAKIERKETQCIYFTVPKVGLRRRIFGIPNPMHQIELSKIIAFKWQDIQNIYSDSKISASIPIKDPEGKKAIITKYKYELFKEKCIDASFNKIFELKTDIAKYFPSIYTHSISWAIHTKEKAKLYRNDYTLIGNLIDKAVRLGQYGQTNGIPIGPDTSRIIAEILGCTFDKNLTNEFKDKIVGYRFVDDCLFYFSSYADAELVFKYFEKMLTEFGLNINEEKTTIKKLHYSYESEWSILLANYRIRYKKKRIKNKSIEESRKIRILSQRNDIKNFVSLAFKLKEENPRDSVLKYAIRKFRYKLFKENWNLFESLLYKMGMSEPVILPDILRLLLSNRSWVDESKLKEFTMAILEEHHYKGHNFEIAWGLWIAKSFSLKINDDLAQKIINSSDVISIIIVLDMINEGLISSSIDLSELESELTEEGLFNEWWLLTYESIKKGWLKPKDPDLLRKSLYFSELEQRDIEFYDSSKQIDIEDFGTPGY